MTKKLNVIALCALLVLTLWVRLSTQMIAHTGVDERDYWVSAKAISQGYAYPDLSHRTIRWAVILPVAALQLVFGVHPNVYYIAPILNALLQTALIYAVGVQLKNRKTGIIAAFCMIFFPYQIRAASQVRPEIFSMTYMLLAAFFFIKYIKEEKRRAPFLALTGLIIFVAYESKITNLFFLPGFLLYILIFQKSRKLRDCLILGGIPLILFLAETLIYSLTTPYRFGHLSIITAKHLSGEAMAPISSYLEVFKRYSLEHLQLYWMIPFIAFAALSVLFLAKSKNRSLKFVILSSLSFFFFITFSVSSVRPLKLTEPFINRYFCAVLPGAFLVIAYAADGILRRVSSVPRVKRIAGALPAGLWRNRGALFFAFCVVICACVSIAFSMPFVPKSVKTYAHSPLDLSSHPYVLTAHYYRELSAAYREGVPIAGTVSDAVEAASAFYFAGDIYPQVMYNRALKEAEFIREDGESFTVFYLLKDGELAELKEDAACIRVLRYPFRTERAQVNDIPRFEAETRTGYKP